MKNIVTNIAFFAIIFAMGLGAGWILPLQVSAGIIIMLLLVCILMTAFLVNKVNGDGKK